MRCASPHVAWRDKYIEKAAMSNTHPLCSVFLLFHINYDILDSRDAKLVMGVPSQIQSIFHLVLSGEELFVFVFLSQVQQSSVVLQACTWGLAVAPQLALAYGDDDPPQRSRCPGGKRYI